MERPGQPPFSASVTLCVALALILPFAVATATWTEPWPAVLLPSTAATIPLVDGTATFAVLSVAADGDSKPQVRIDPAKLLAPMPVHFLYAVAMRGFGQDRSEYRAIYTKRGGFSWQFRRSPASPTAREHALGWLRARVTSTVRDATELVIRQDLVTVDLESDRELRKEVGVENAVSLR